MAKFDFKQAMIQHVEKVLFGIIILMTLLGLAGTDWSAYKGTPREITQKVEQGRNNLAVTVWPDEEREKYALNAETAPKQVVRDELYVSISPAQYESSTRFTLDPAGGKDPLREIEKSAPEDLIATPGRVLIETYPETDESEIETELAAVTPKEDEVPEGTPDEFLARPKTGLSGSGEGDDYFAPELEAMQRGSYDTSTALPSEDGTYSYLDGLEGSGELGATMPTKNGEGYPFVSVRAVFPVREQIAKYAEATHVSFAEASRMFYIIDFELQRQEMRPDGTWPAWNDETDAVDIQVATDVLERTVGYDADVVNSAITDPVVTMPLPMRISGRWYSQATHPRIKNFVLTDKQIEIETELNALILEKALEARKATKETKVQRGGFVNLSFNSSEMQSSLVGADYSYDSSSYMMEPAGMSAGRGGPRGRTSAKPVASGMDQLLDQLVDADDKEKREALSAWIQERAKADGELLLFRYIDFGVEPGKTYRYRVRFVIPNPNYGRRIAEADGLAHVIEGEIRHTDWSNVTEPASVPASQDFFLAGVREPNRSRNNEMLPSALMDVFQWDNRYGTTMNDVVEVRPGQQVGEVTTTTVIKPTENVYDEEEYEFKSDNFIADVIGDLEIDPKLHGEGAESIKLMRGANGYMLAQGQALVVDDEMLTIYDDDGQRSQRTALAKRQEQQNTYFEDIKKAREAAEVALAGSELDVYGLEAGSADEMMMYGSSGEGGRQRNVLRRSSRSKSKRAAMGGMGIDSPYAP
ncbi:MAG: hypothetical protein KDA58_05220 [Planctomycetaceae bacterium]|nr:hypothetical protein [Planctomycetaceae bacterium]